jgi:rhamnogalacturonyl hydrolase YesR
MPEGDDIYSREHILSIMHKVNDYQLDNPWKETDRNWIRATYYTGVMAFYQATGDPRIYRQALRWAEKHNWQVGDEKAGSNILTCGQTYLELYFVDKDTAKIAPLIRWIDSGEPNAPTGADVWYLENGLRYADALYVGPPTLTMLSKVTGDKKYLEFMDAFYWDVHGLLFDEEDGLFYRDKRFIGVKNENGNKIFWARGNGWVLAGLPRILKHLPADHPTYDRYLALYRRMAAAVSERQQPDGLWRTNLNDPTEYPMRETSSTGFFCYALAWGVNNGILDRRIYTPVVKKAWAGLVRSVSEEGKVQWGQLVGYKPVPVEKEHSHEYVTGTFLLAGSEMLHLILNTKGKDRR